MSLTHGPMVSVFASLVFSGKKVTECGPLVTTLNKIEFLFRTPLQQKPPILYNTCRIHSI